ncbi:MAG: glucose 1-dehydrogenase [Acidimicrobiales bacterium]|nr:glucose 1-dehydrogenase [Acidimicrobiales bacterium]
MTGVLDRFRLDGQVAIVVGAGRGMGAAIARALAEAGADVVVAARSRAEIDTVAADIRDRGSRALAVACDVLDAEQRQALVDATIEEFGRLDILVNNAGGFGPRGALDTSVEEFEDCFRFNVAAVFGLTQIAAPVMANTAGAGSVINIGSTVARAVGPGFAAYATAKSALSSLTELLAQDFAPKVRVNAVLPGPTRSGTIATVLAGDDDGAIEAMMASRNPLARIAEPEDIAAAVLFLASSAASFVSGEILGVTGAQQHAAPMPRADI